MDELWLEFHCVLELEDRSGNVNGTFLVGSCLPITFWEEVLQNCFVLQVFNMHFGRKSRTKCVIERSGSTKCCVFQYKGWLRTWQVKLCGMTVSGRSRVMLGSCSNVSPSVSCARVVDGIPLRVATPGWFPRCKCDCECCWWMSCRWNFIVFCNFRIVPAM